MVDKQFLETQRELLTDHGYRSEYLAEFLDSNSAVFGYDYLQAALAAPQVDKGFVAVGIDWARHRDYSAAIAVRGMKQRAEVIAVDAWKDMSWSDIVARTAAFSRDVGANHVMCDGTGVGDSVTENLAETLEFVRIDKTIFSNQSKAALIRELVWMLEKGRLRLPSDIDLLRELEAYEVKYSGATMKFAASSGHDDRVCALALACSVLPQGGTVTIQGKDRK
jgi:hypothetical protein